MPTLNLKIAPLQNPGRYRQLAQALTALAAQWLGKRPEVTAVVLQDLPAAQWFIGGEEVQRPTALLEIDVTAGTNTATQKAAFIAAAHAELRRQLGAGGDLASGTYVIVHELPATDWGYDGRTQRQRQLEREPAVPA